MNQSDLSIKANLSNRTRSPLWDRSVGAVVASETISSLGSQMSFLALPWFVLTTTGSASKMGLTFAADLLPIAILGIPSGTWVQRLGVRRTMIVSDGVRAIVMGLIPVFYSAGILSFPLLLLILVMLGTLTAPYIAAQRLVIPATVGDDEALVIGGTALVEGGTRLATLMGPAIAGVLIAALGAVNVIWIDAVTYAVSLFILLFGLSRGHARLEPSTDESGGLLAGARFVLSNPILRRVTIASLLFGLFFPMLLAALPIITKTRYGSNAQVAGLLFGAWGGGALIGTYVVLRFAARMPPLKMGAYAALAMSVPLWVVPFSLPWWVLGLLLLLSGVFTPLLNAPIVTLLLLRTPEALRAKTITFVMTANLLTGPAGYVLAGILIGPLGDTRLLLVVAVGITLAAATLLTLRRAAPETS